MASLRQLFPSFNPHAKTKRNFIKENIRNAKGCAQCIAEKRQLNIKNNDISRNEKFQRARYNKFKSESDLGKSEVKFKNRTSSSALNRKDNPHNSRNEGRNDNHDSKLLASTKCQTCGQSVPSKNKELNEEEKGQNDDYFVQNKQYHQLSHEKEENSKKSPLKKSLDLSCYKKGEVPRYLQDRMAKLMKEEKERIEREELAEKLGWNDPRCPPGHMLMSPENLKNCLDNFSKQYQKLINELNTMPITKDSLRIRNRKIEIEKELKELDDKIMLYKSGKVFVKIPH